jgi:sugar lactone lactonase YvrE
VAEIVNQTRSVLAEGFCLTEAPRWRDGRLYFSDIHGHKVHAVDLAGRVETITAFDSPCSGLGFTPNGDLLISLMAETKVVRLSEGKLSDHADVSRFADEHINDMIVDTSGLRDPARPSPHRGLPGQALHPDHHRRAGRNRAAGP